MYGVLYLWGLLPGFLLMFIAMLVAGALDNFDLFLAAAGLPWVFAAIWAAVGVLTAKRGEERL